MARTTLVKTVATGPYGAAGVGVTLAAADIVNQNQFVTTGKELVIAHNTAAAAPHTVTITSSVNAKNRTGDITAEAIAAAAIRVFGPFPIDGWQQIGTQYVYLEANDAEVFFGVVVLP